MMVADISLIESKYIPHLIIEREPNIIIFIKIVFRCLTRWEISIKNYHNFLTYNHGFRLCYSEIQYMFNIRKIQLCFDIKQIVLQSIFRHHSFILM